MKHQRAVRIDDPFGKTGGAGGKAHGRAVVLADGRVAKIAAGFSEQFLIVQKTFGYVAATVGDDNYAFERRVLAEFFVDRQEDIVNQQKAVAGMPGYRADFMRMQAEIQGVQDAASAGHAEEGFQVAGVVPHHGSDAVAGLHAEFSKGFRKEARAAIEFAIAAARDGLIGLARNDLDARKDFSG